MKEIYTLETNKYRELMNYLFENNSNLVNKLEQERLKYVLEQIKLINKDGIFSYLLNEDINTVKNILPKSVIELIDINLKYNDYNSINRILKLYTEKCLLEFIIDLYFKEITYNFILNLKTMIKYINSIEENVIPKERLIFYKKILNFYNLSVEEQKQLYYDYNKDINYISNFYDDFNFCKVHSYEMINNSIIKPSKLNSLCNYKLSLEKGVNIYELNTEEFYIYVHVCSIKDSDNKTFPFKKSNNSTISLSLIGNNYIGTYKPIYENIILGFDKLNPSNIIHLYNSDSYTGGYKSSRKVQKIYSPKELLKDTYGYNEILYSQKNIEDFYPSYIICFDNIRDIDLYFAHKEKLPIIKINSLNLRRSNNTEDSLENIYISADEASNISSYRNL